MITLGEYLEYRRGYLEYHEGCSVPWGDIMIHVGRYHEYGGGCSVSGGNCSIHFQLIRSVSVCHFDVSSFHLTL